jgi:transcriptional regulatory protein RtcR
VEVNCETLRSLDRYAGRHNTRVTFNKEARNRFLSFSVSGEARWTVNFLDLIGAVTRMATLSHGGRITRDNVDEEIPRLKSYWRSSNRTGEDRMVTERGILPKCFFVDRQGIRDGIPG